MRFRKLVIGGGAGLIVIASGCFKPTEITLDITTNVDCQTGIREVDIYISGKGDPTPTAPSAVAYTCVDPASDHVGSLVVVPSSRGDTVNIAVVAVLTGAPSCTPESTDVHCIVARRSLDYITHTPLDLPVFLDSSCAGFACPDTETCVAHDGIPQCVGDNPTCTSTNTCGLDAGASDAAPTDAIARDVVALDGALDGASDGGVCPSPAIGVYSQKPTYAWSFENTLAENSALFALQSKNSTTSYAADGAPSCGEYVIPGGLQQALTPAAAGLAMNHFAIAAWVKGPPSTTTNANIAAVGTGTMGAKLSIVTGVLTGQLCDSTICHVVADTGTLPIGSWSSIVLEIQQQPGLVSLYRNGALVNTAVVVVSNYIAPDGPLVAGPTSGVDQVEFYPLN